MITENHNLSEEQMLLFKQKALHLLEDMHGEGHSVYEVARFIETLTIEYFKGCPSEFRLSLVSLYCFALQNGVSDLE
jgi:hypothetical protein